MHHIRCKLQGFSFARFKAERVLVRFRFHTFFAVREHERSDIVGIGRSAAGRLNGTFQRASAVAVTDDRKVNSGFRLAVVPHVYI